MAVDGKFKIVVVVDPEGRHRGIFWENEIAKYNAATRLRQQYGDLPEAIYVPVQVAADVMKPHGTYGNLIHHLVDADLVIFNWDVLNGDPMFGADVAAAFTRHYRTNLQDFVYAGGVLVVEGQANRNIPVQAAYDAILGVGELRLSGEEDPLQAGMQRHFEAVQKGTNCVATSQAKGSRLFREADGMSSVYASVDREFADYFPCHGPEVPLPPSLMHPAPTVLWRGWFRRRGLHRRRFAWVPLLKTDERGLVSHPTLLVARHGKGVIFAATTHLALGQENPYLLTALVRVRRDPTLLPSPGARLPRAVDQATVFAGLATLLYFFVMPAVLDADAPAWVKALGGAGLSLAVSAVVGSRRWVARTLRRVL